MRKKRNDFVFTFYVPSAFEKIYLNNIKYTSFPSFLFAFFRKLYNMNNTITNNNHQFNFNNVEPLFHPKARSMLYQGCQLQKMKEVKILT
jgi:hypothetical protein